LKKAFNFILIILLITAGIWVADKLINKGSSDYTNTYNKYFNPCPNYWTTDSAFKDTNSMAIVAMRYYDVGNYNLAIEAFQRFEPKVDDEGFYNLYLGIAYQRSGFENLSINHLIVSSDSFKDFYNIHVAKWYLALAFLKDGRIDECQAELDEIIKINASYKGIATSLKKDLKGSAYFWSDWFN